MIFWSLMIAAVPSLFVLLRARRLDHFVFFSAGYLYYWILPVLVGEFPGIGAQSNVALQKWVGMFTRLPSQRLYAYIVSIFVYYACFGLGDTLARRVRRRRWVQVDISLQFIPTLYTIVFIASLILTYQMRWAIGSNYLAVQEGAIAKGTLTAMSLTLFGLALMKVLEGRPRTLKAMVLNRWMMGYFLIALALLGMGQRLHFVTSLFLLLSYRSLFIKKFSATQLGLGALAAASIAAAMGLLRLRAGFSTGALLQNLAFEPVFTSFSLVSFLQENPIPWLEVPRLLAGDFLNLIPTAILPNKVDLLLEPSKAGYWFASPLGAMNSWVSFMINFGLVGTGLVMVAIGYGMRWLFLRANSPLGLTQYLMCSAFMVFTFFRDPFSVSIVKNIFEFSLMMPLGLALLSSWVVWCAGGNSGVSNSPGHAQPT